MWNSKIIILILLLKDFIGCHMRTWSVNDFQSPTTWTLKELKKKLGLWDGKRGRLLTSGLVEPGACK